MRVLLILFGTITMMCLATIQIRRDILHISCRERLDSTEKMLCIIAATLFFLLLVTWVVDIWLY